MKNSKVVLKNKKSILWAAMFIPLTMASFASQAATAIQDGDLLTGLSAKKGDVISYYIDVPRSGSPLSIYMTGGTGDADFELTSDAMTITYSSYEELTYEHCIGALSVGAVDANEEACYIDNATEGRYEINITAWEDFSGVSLGVASDAQPQVLSCTDTTDTFTIKAQDLEFIAKHGDEACKQLRDIENLFHTVFNTGRDPVSNDVNDQVDINLFANHNAYRTAGKQLFNQTSDTGVYLEGTPEQASSQSNIITFEAQDWADGQWYPWSFTHEVVHYLDGRYLKEGDFSKELPHLTYWWAEGMAEFISEYNTPYGTVRYGQAAQVGNDVTLSEIILDNTDDPYGLGAVAIRYLIEEQPTATQELISELRAGDFDAFDSLLTTYGTRYNSDFRSWLTGDLVNDFPDSAKKLNWNQTETVTTEPGSLYYIDISSGDDFTVQLEGGGGNGSLYVGKVGSVPNAFQPDTVACFSGHVGESKRIKLDGNVESCQITEASAGRYYILVEAPGNSVVVNASLTVNNATPLPAPATKVCMAEIEYFDRNSSVDAEVTVTNTASTEVSLFWLNTDGNIDGDSYAELAKGESWTADYWVEGDRLIAIDENNNCAGVFALNGGSNTINIGEEVIIDIPTDNEYQAPAANNTNWEYIESVTIAGNNTTSGDDNGYGDFSTSAPISITNGDVISLDASGNSDENWIVWVDMNGDYSFSTNEIVYQSDNKSNEVTGTLSQLDSANGLTTRMRIAMSYGTPNATGGFEGEIEDYTVTINDAGNGCEPNCNTGEYEAPAENNTNWEHIDSVTVAGQGNTSGDDNGYGDFSGLSAITIADGDEISLSASGNSDENWIVYVDLDGNFEFSSNEIVYQSSSKSNDITGTLSNLASANGLTTRMRVAMSYGTPNATGGFEGEIEDYSVTIGDGSNGCEPNCNSELPIVEAHSVTVASGEYLHIPIEVPAGATSINVDLDKNGGTAMLMLNEGSQGSASNYDERDTLGDNVFRSKPSAGTWYISIRGRNSGVTDGSLTITID
ncbi:collagenase [Colwellia psychrerythraea]|uniref:Peptidase M9A collagenase n=1 Tax=Colwellia psychrerythraea TaxID=28229 RepID=A0A099L1G8_COLPS|nr:collagenase [Colwellia psychrerythraea]KGJ96824.1 peptidase M9A collagenase [Colwellia psychrerythraea]